MGDRLAGNGGSLIVMSMVLERQLIWPSLLTVALLSPSSHPYKLPPGNRLRKCPGGFELVPDDSDERYFVCKCLSQLVSSGQAILHQPKPQDIRYLLIIVIIINLAVAIVFLHNNSGS
jgi:hypothetical protein